MRGYITRHSLLLHCQWYSVPTFAPTDTASVHRHFGHATHQVEIVVIWSAELRYCLLHKPDKSADSARKSAVLLKDEELLRHVTRDTCIGELTCCATAFWQYANKRICYVMLCLKTFWVNIVTLSTTEWMTQFCKLAHVIHYSLPYPNIRISLNKLTWTAATLLFKNPAERKATRVHRMIGLEDN